MDVDPTKEHVDVTEYEPVTLSTDNVEKTKLIGDPKIGEGWQDISL